YLGWSWNTWSCSAGPSLITSYDGTPTPFGVGLRDRLGALAAATPPSAPAPPPSPSPSAPVAIPGGWVVTSDGRVVALGSAPFLGDLAGHGPAAPVVALGA